MHVLGLDSWVMIHNVYVVNSYTTVLWVSAYGCSTHNPQLFTTLDAYSIYSLIYTHLLPRPGYEANQCTAMLTHAQKFNNNEWAEPSHNCDNLVSRLLIEASFANVMTVL